MARTLFIKLFLVELYLVWFPPRQTGSSSGQFPLQSWTFHKICWSCLQWWGWGEQYTTRHTAHSLRKYDVNKDEESSFVTNLLIAPFNGTRLQTLLVCANCPGTMGHFRPRHHQLCHSVMCSYHGTFCINNIARFLLTSRARV